MPPEPVTLPQIRRTCGDPPLKKSRMGKWRTAVLIGIHLLAAIHIWHWLSAGKTITPLEPSESMYTITKGLVNAGVVLFTLAILSTLIFGRFFCGWGCHIIALQDASTWLLNKIGIRPKPFRSRVLIFVPLIAAIYMFVVPLVYRLYVQFVLDRPVPALEPHFTTEDFWDTFPGLWVGGLTFLTVGFIIVYFLGNKGFCTYGCPYGGFFGVADKVAPIRIRVTDDCEQCGHCTASCTSNVRVHEEVRDFRMVVDPGCMKCLDCISVCPKDALYVGAGRPAIGADKRAQQATKKQKRRFDFSWPEEIALVAFFILTMLVLRFFEKQQLYEAFPLLFALGLSAISAYLLLMFARLFYQRNQRVARWNVKKAGKLTRGGVGFAVAMLAWIGFLIHSATVQTLEWNATQKLDAAKDSYAVTNSLNDDSREQFASALDSLKTAAKWSLVRTYRIEGNIGSALRYLDRDDEAKPYFERAVAKSPASRIGYRDQLAQIAIKAGDYAAARDWLQRVVKKQPEYEDSLQQLVNLNLQQRKPAQAIAAIRAAIAKRPRNHSFHFLLARTYLQIGQPNEADDVIQEHLENAHDPAAAYAQAIPFWMGSGQIARGNALLDEALQKFPDEPAINRFAAMRAAQADDLAAAEKYVARALAVEPEDSETHFMAFQLAAAAQDLDRATKHIEAALANAPERADFLQAWAQLSAVGGRSATLVEEFEAKVKPTRAELFRLLALYDFIGATDRAAALRTRLKDE